MTCITKSVMIVTIGFHRYGKDTAGTGVNAVNEKHDTMELTRTVGPLFTPAVAIGAIAPDCESRYDRLYWQRSRTWILELPLQKSFKSYSSFHPGSPGLSLND